MLVSVVSSGWWSLESESTMTFSLPGIVHWL
jgi:hypothetical protein